MASELAPTADALRKMLDEETVGMERRRDPGAGYCVMAGYSPLWKKELYFGGVREGKSYVSYYLFPVYMVPELLAKASPELKRRVQGKSCFNFRTIEPALLDELRALTRRCRQACEDGTIEIAKKTAKKTATKAAKKTAKRR